MYYNYEVKKPNGYYSRYIVSMFSVFTVHRVPLILKSILILESRTSNNYYLILSMPNAQTRI